MSVPATFFLGGAQALGIDFLNPSPDNYAIVTSGSTAPVITPDNVIGLEYRGEQRIGTFPVEEGGFSSYNKVAVPYDLRMRMTCGGRNYLQSALQTVTQTIDAYINTILGTAYGQPMTREDFLTQLDVMLNSLDLYDVVTPDMVYKSVNLVHVDFSKKNDEGAVLIIAELWFQEVRETVSAAYSSSAQQVNSNSASAASSVNTGTVTYALGTKAQQDIMGSVGFQ